MKKEREREEREEKGLYIPDALSGQNGRTDLHQGNHGYTSYGKSLYTRVYRFIDESLSVFHFALRTFLVGARAKITDGKLGVRPVYVGVSSHLSREIGRASSLAARTC